MNKTYVIGDIHGAYKALLQCLERSDFDYENDTLIQLGDVCDGWSETYECVEELLKIKNLIPIRGNHDAILLEWMSKGQHPWSWLQGGYGTKKSLKGLLMVGNPNREGMHIVMQECTPEDESKGLLQVIYEDGKFYNQTTLEEIRKRLLDE